MTMTNTAATDPAEWGFVSGMISSLESELLPRSFFEAVAKSQSRSEVRAALGKSIYRAYFPDDKSLDAASAVLDARGKEIRAEIFKSCPPHPITNYFGIGDRFRTFRTLFNQACKQSNPPVGELENFFNLFAVEPEYNAGLREHRSMLTRTNPPQSATPMERSLFLDSAACSLMSAVAERTPEPLVRQYMRDRALLTAWSGIFRLRWSGVPADMIRKWYIFENSNEFATSVLALEHEPRAVIFARLSTQSAMILDHFDVPRIKEDIDGVVSEVLRDTVLQCRLMPSGPERVLAYLVSVDVELVNLELSLGAAVQGIDRDLTLSRLRREYA